jgi:mRNA interferase MazF
MVYKPFAIVVLPFPFTDSAEAKNRPALVISSEHYQRENRHISLLMITTAKHSQWYGDHQIIDLKSSGLSTPSIIRQKLFTIDSRLIKKQIGMLGKEDRKKIVSFLEQHICVNENHDMVKSD